MQPHSLFDLCKAHGHDVFDGPTLARKAAVGTFDAVSVAEWYQHNGYRTLASLYSSQSESEVMGLSAVCGCAKILGEDVGSLPLHVYERLRGGKEQEKARGHYLYPRLHDSANPDTTAIEFRESMTATAALNGAAFAKIDFSSSGGSRVIALWHITGVRVDKDSRNQRVFLWKDGNEPEETLTSDQVLYLRGFSATGREPLKFIQVARRVLSLAREQEDYAADFFANDRTPGIALKYPNRLGPEEVKLLREAWVESVKRHGVAVAHSGAEPVTLGSTNTDAQLLEQRNFALLEVCRYFRMPPHKLADLSRANFTNIENENNGYYTNTLRPWLVRWEQAINLRCFPITERTRYFAQHSVEGFLRGDWKAQTEGFAKLLEKGVYSVNEVRAFIGLNPVPGGDERYIQLNMQRLIDAASGMPVEDEPQGSQQQPAAVAGSRLFRVKGISE